MKLSDQCPMYPIISAHPILYEYPVKAEDIEEEIEEMEIIDEEEFD